MRLHIVTCNVGGMFPDDPIDESGDHPSKETMDKVAMWKDAIVSRIEVLDELPLLITICIQELGGKCKTNVEKLSRPGDVFASMICQLQDAINALYVAKGRSIWTGELAFNPHQSLPAGTSSTFFSGGPCPKPHEEGGETQVAGAGAASSEDRATLFQEFPHIEPDGNVEGFTGLACIFMADKAAIDTGQLHMFHFGEGKWMPAAQALPTFTPQMHSVLGALGACHHRKMYSDSRKGFLHSRWRIEKKG
eukprot:CAMPEP_0181334224 /NCGR_PEP_ID=MMETSP1101-20121128/26128_1 /TAXON_ID=46948 /ORGANISM="Rhodomonas abbreviata, Strain Caron Lab Isolate" /LENGTH=248 /DNA_ID=CAMNT_0023444151 /DNA_START=359 /DNA_END=1101 /DNA_ORIENTATION=+